MDYGNSLTPWSVGKYAKRSATIHLNSNDLMPNNAHQFADAMVVDQTATGIALSEWKMARLSTTTLFKLLSSCCYHSPTLAVR